MKNINWQNLFIVAALVMAALGLILPQGIAPAAPVVAPQSFQCSPGAMCVQDGGKTVTFPSGSTLDVDSGSTFTVDSALNANGGAAITGSVTISGFTQYPFVFFGNDSAINGTMIEHGRGQTLTYPWCMVYDAAWVTVTARISATNATSATLAIFDATGEPWTTSGVPVRCGAVYVP